MCFDAKLHDRNWPDGKWVLQTDANMTAEEVVL